MRQLLYALLFILLSVKLCFGSDLETISPTLEGNWTFNNTVANEVLTISADDVTPDVSSGNVFITSANTGATAITDLDNPTAGQFVTLVGGSATNSSTIADSGNFNLTASWTAGLDDVLVLFVQADNDYIEVFRANN